MPRKSKLHIKINRLKRKIHHLTKNNKLYIAIFFVFILFLFGIKIFYNKYVNNPENIVSNIYFDKKYINNNNLDNLIKTTTSTFSGTNTAKNKILNYKSEKEFITSNFPFLEKINIEVLSKNTLKVSYNFKKPKLLMVGSGETFAVYGNKNFIQKFDNNFLSGLNLDTKEQINLPSYIDTSNNLKGIFWKHSVNKLITYIKKIKKEFPQGVLFYIVGGENIKVINNGKTIYFSLEKDIDKQLSQLNLIKDKKPKLYTGSTEIDIGNLDEGGYFKVIK